MKDTVCFILIVFILGVTLWGIWPKGVLADNAIDAIVGEASNQSIGTMICVAQAIRHRGTLKGVYGFHARHNSLEQSSTWQTAADAWSISGEVFDRVNGAKNFASIDDFNSGKVKLKNIKAHCGDFIFY